MKITDPGPIFFGQRRVGKDRKIFKCWKFRTMVVGAEDILAKWLEENPEIKEEFQKDFKLKNDPRVTKLGNFLRKTSLDELPQLWNVLNGTMSLVGPRPIVEKEVEKYGEYAETFFRVLPGITGLWQISGRNDVDYKDRIELDMYYIKNWTVWLDIYVLFGTIPAVLKRKGAY
jgi:Undecaprenyl-phosphate galactose phosphotransferase WbaP